MLRRMTAWPLQLLCLAALVSGCAQNPDKHTISDLRQRAPDLTEAVVDDSLVKAMESYREFLHETPAHTMAPEAMRRLADLQIEKEYGVIGDTAIRDLPVPDAAITPIADLDADSEVGPAQPSDSQPTETDAEFERRTTARQTALLGEDISQVVLPEGAEPLDPSGPLQAIETYQRILKEYPWYERNDQVLYQMARAYDELAQPDEAMAVVERLIAEYPGSRYVDEVFFRRGEYYFVRKKYLDAEEAYLAVVAMGESSTFYELALYKLGWSLYKQELYEDALHQYIALLDFKLSEGYDFEAAGLLAGGDSPDTDTVDPDTLESDNAENSGGENTDGDERRVADTFRVVSLSFSNLGGPEVLSDYFETQGHRIYEDRVYHNLAEFHLSKRRFTDAASVYDAFVELNPFHKIAPHFSIRVAEIYTEGNFPLLVVESKRDFATRYGVQAEYWQYFDMAGKPEVIDYLKTNLTDLANHYHALYQNAALAEQQPTNYGEALHWYGEFLVSFPEDELSPTINYQLADLVLEFGDFARAAQEYERTAYDYPAHEQSSSAGYAAIYAHREFLEVVSGEAAPAAKRATVDSSLKFAKTFPGHEHAATILGAAAEDLYDLREFEEAVLAGRWLIADYPEADIALRRPAWMIVAHSSFDLANYPDAEEAYSAVLTLSTDEDEDRQAVVDNLAASIYKQGEQARLLDDYAAAADHFLRIKTVAPTSAVRPAAEYDAAAALIHLEDWLAAAEVLEDFRSSYPEHELRSEATRQLAMVYEEAGELSRSAGEYERVADDAQDPEMRREAILVAGDLYEQDTAPAEALRVYEQYIGEFPEPLETAVEIRFKVAGMYQTRGDNEAYLAQLQDIVTIDGAAGEARTDRSRFLAAKSALVLTRPAYDHFTELALTQPFEESLAEKRRRMDETLGAFEQLVDYQVGEVTAAATYYIAEIYGHFSNALLDSERPDGLDAAELNQYELVIEEEAYPFEERSIEVHEENLELLRVGMYNDWIQQSLDELAILMPGRYAKHEISSGFIGSIDGYAYRSPMAPPAGLAETAEISQVDLPDPRDQAGADDAESY